MPNGTDTVEDVIRNMDLEIQRLRAERDRIDNEIQRTEEAKRIVLSFSRGGTSRGTVSLAKTPKSIFDAPPAEPDVPATSQRQHVIDLAIAILKDRDNKPIRRDELWAEMQARGLQLKNSNPTHYIASKILGGAKDIFGNQNGYYLLNYPAASES